MIKTRVDMEGFDLLVEQTVMIADCVTQKTACSAASIHCKNKSVYCTPFCPNTHTVFVFGVCIGTI